MVKSTYTCPTCGKVEVSRPGRPLVCDGPYRPSRHKAVRMTEAKS